MSGGLPQQKVKGCITSHLLSLLQLQIKDNTTPVFFLFLNIKNSKDIFSVINSETVFQILTLHNFLLVLIFYKLQALLNGKKSWKGEFQTGG